MENPTNKWREYLLAQLKKRLVGKTQKALAAELGVTAQYLGDVLRGRRYPGPKIEQGVARRGKA